MSTGKVYLINTIGKYSRFKRKMQCAFCFAKTGKVIEPIAITLRLFASLKVASNFITTILQNAISGHSVVHLQSLPANQSRASCCGSVVVRV